MTEFSSEAGDQVHDVNGVQADYENVRIATAAKTGGSGLPAAHHVLGALQLR